MNLVPMKSRIGSRVTFDIGGSGNLAERVPKKLTDPKFRGQARFFRFVEDYDPDLTEAELQAEFMARYGRCPKFTGRLQREAYDILEEILG